MTATIAIETGGRVRKTRPPRPLRAKVPMGMFIAAAIIATIGVLAGNRPSENSVSRAIHAPFDDVGILPVEDSIAFWQGRVDGNPSDYLSKTKLAGAIMLQAKETGDLSLYPKAEDVLYQALAQNPHDEGALLALAGARSANHDFATSLDLANQVLARNPDSKAAQVTIADDNFELGNYDLASQQLDDLVRVLPPGVGVDSRVAKLSAVEGRIDEAIARSASAVIAASELDLRASEAAFYRFQLGHFLFQAGRLDDALAALNAGLAIDPNHLASLEAKAQVLVALGRLDEARDLYEQLVVRTPAADLHGELAKVYRALGRDADADAQISAGLSIGYEQLATYPAERRHLASFFAEFEPTTALVAAKADFDTRKDVGAYDALGWAYYQNGQYAEAEQYVDGALAQGTRDAALLYHAGMIEKAAGNDARATDLLRDALSINPQFDLVQAPKAKAALAELETT